MRRLLATTALALLLSAPFALILHAQDSGGGAGSDSGASGGTGGSSTDSSGGGGDETTGGNTGGSGGSIGGGAGGSTGSTGFDQTTGGNTGGTAGSTEGGTGTTSGSASGNESGGTTGAMTTTPRAKADDAAGTRGTAAAPAADWGSTTGGDLVGRTVYGSNGEEIGDIQDIVTRSGSSSPEALVGVGGFLGIGERDVAIPLSQLRMEGDRVTTTMTKENLTAMQPYDQSGYTPWDRSRAVGQ
jgi:hypothetical protein